MFLRTVFCNYNAAFPNSGVGGTVEKATASKILKFKTYSESLINPTFTVTDYQKDPKQIHVAFVALNKFVEKHNRLPANGRDKEEFFRVAQVIR